MELTRDRHGGEAHRRSEETSSSVSDSMAACEVGRQLQLEKAAVIRAMRVVNRLLQNKGEATNFGKDHLSCLVAHPPTHLLRLLSRFGEAFEVM